MQTEMKPDRLYKVIIPLNPVMKELFRKGDTLRYLADLYLNDQGLPRLENVEIPNPEYRLRLANDLYRLITGESGAKHFIRDISSIYSQGYRFESCNNKGTVYDFTFKHSPVCAD